MTLSIELIVVLFLAFLINTLAHVFLVKLLEKHRTLKFNLILTVLLIPPLAFIVFLMLILAGIGIAIKNGEKLDEPPSDSDLIESEFQKRLRKMQEDQKQKREQKKQEE
jgi:ABC-type uncharacterized transport system fused permease/ATPase subunit